MTDQGGLPLAVIRSRLDCVARELDAVCQALDRDPAAGGRQPLPDDKILGVAQVVQSTRRKRREHFRSDLLGEPAWDMLLDLFVARLRGEQVSVSAVCLAAQVPPTTALRYLAELERGGEVVRSSDPSDNRRKLIRLSDEAAESIRACLSQMQHRLM